MKKLSVFDKYETPYSWKESVRSGVPVKKKKSCSGRLVTALQLGLTVIAVCTIGAFIYSFGFNNIISSDSSSQITPHSGDFSTNAVNPLKPSDSSSADGHDKPAGKTTITGNVSLFRSNGYMIIKDSTGSYNIKVPNVVVNEENMIITLTDEIKGYIAENKLEARLSYDGNITTFEGEIMYPQIDNSYSMVVDLSQMPEDYKAPERSQDDILMENAYNAYCSSFDGYRNAYNDVMYNDFISLCKTQNDKLTGQIKNKTGFDIHRITPVGVFADKFSRINSSFVADEFRYVFALTPNDSTDTITSLIDTPYMSVLAYNSTELETIGIEPMDDGTDVKRFYYSSTPEAVYVVVCMSMGETNEPAQGADQKILENGTALEFAIGKLDSIDISSIKEGGSKLFCFCENSLECKHNKKVDVNESNVFVAVSITAKTQEGQMQ